MRARLLAVSLVLAACGGKPPVEGEADAGIDAPSSARQCEADRPMPLEQTSNGSMGGAWQVTWTCLKGCPLRRPGLTYSPRLTVDGDTLHFSNPLCPDCRADVAGAVTIDGCVDVVGRQDFDSQCRFSYRVCEMEGQLNGTLTWKEPGVSEQVWQLHGTR